MSVDVVYMVVSVVDDRLVNEDIRAIIDQLLRVSVLAVSEWVQDWRILIVSSLMSTGQGQWTWSSSSICNESHIWSRWVVGWKSSEEEWSWFSFGCFWIKSRDNNFFFFFLRVREMKITMSLGSRERLLFIPSEQEQEPGKQRVASICGLENRRISARK